LEQLFLCVAKRGQAMNLAASKCKGGMAAVLNGKLSDIENTVQELQAKGIIQIANLNSEKQVILSGDETLLKEAAEKLKNLGCKKIIPLNVSGPWHSEFMNPAAEEMNSFLKTIHFHSPQIPVYSNVTADIYPDNKDETADLLVKQIISPVNWLKEIETMKNNGIDTMIELSPNKVLQGIIKKIDSSVQVISFDTLENLDLLQKIGKE